MNLSDTPVKTPLALTDEIPVFNKGRGSRMEKTTLSALQTLIGGGGGGGGTIQVYSEDVTDPNGFGINVDDPNSPAVFYQDNTGVINVWVWSVGAQTWFQILG